MPPSVASVADTDLSTELSTVQTSSDRTLNTTAAVAARPSYAIFARPKSILQQIKAQENIQDGDLGPNYKDWQSTDCLDQPLGAASPHFLRAPAGPCNQG